MPERRRRLWCFMDLICDPSTGKIRETLLWSNAGKLAALVWFCVACYRQTDTEMLWAIVMGVLTAHELFSRWMSQRLGVKTESITTIAATVEEKRL